MESITECRRWHFCSRAPTCKITYQCNKHLLGKTGIHFRKKNFTPILLMGDVHTTPGVVDQKFSTYPFKGNKEGGWKVLKICFLHIRCWTSIYKTHGLPSITKGEPTYHSVLWKHSHILDRYREKKFSSLVHTMLIIMLVVLRMVAQEQLATFVHASENYAS